MGWCRSNLKDIELSTFKGAWFEISYPSWWDISPFNEVINNLQPDHKKDYESHSNKFWWESGNDKISFIDPSKEIWMITITSQTWEDEVTIHPLNAYELKETLDMIELGIKQQLLNLGWSIIWKEIYKGSFHNNEESVWFIIKIIWPNPANKNEFTTNINGISFRWVQTFFVWFTSSSESWKKFMEGNYKKILDSFESE